ncbi:putative oligomeric Golgi complex subunit 4 [Triangularia verruculosa]|uniref:Conserved oligomeric Golgi complex subunit 4 n=1 Tax=Triangularia verruculosa TaxID=2587418 RepID=A0AAN6XKS9_9PEZI|nr:putative oligomeric Golgi complex subunit 4 [Triangularia verruculosa]
MSALSNGAATTTKMSATTSPNPALTMAFPTLNTPKPTTTTNSNPSTAIQTATSPADIRAALAALHTRESAVTDRLTTLISSQADLTRSLSRLDNLRAGLGAQVIASRGISNSMLASASETASHLSSRVRTLDLEKSRVEDTLRVVEQVAELKACVAGVVGSMGAPQDWEAAAGYIARASKVPEEIVRGGFAAAVVPTVEVPDPPWVTLEAARESLCNLFLREFKKAAEEGDGARVTRFFKLFPLIGRGDVGLDVYGQYVCQGVAGTARTVLKEGASTVGGQGRKDGFFFANALTRLFEHIAHIVDGHGGLVERHYGTGKMVKVIERLQMEADVQGGIILDSWSDERTVDRRLTDVRSYPFSFLVQSFVSQSNRGFGGTPRVNSPAVGGTNNGRQSEDEGVDMKEVDALVSEIAIMLQRWSLYSRFLAGKCREPDSSDEAPLTMPEVLTKSNLGRKVANKLVSPYNELTKFFFRRSVEKAFQLDEFPSGLTLRQNKPIESNPPFIISAVDDVMYIAKTVIEKSISTSQKDVVKEVIPTIQALLGTDFVGLIQRKMRDEYLPKPNVQGGFPPEDKIVAFIVLINSLDVANEYLDRIVSGILKPPENHSTEAAQPSSALAAAFPFANDAKEIVTRLQNLKSSFQLKSSELIKAGIEVLFSEVVYARLRPVITSTFSDANYTISTEEELIEWAAQSDKTLEEYLEQVPLTFELGWDALMKPISRLLTPTTYNQLMDKTAVYLAQKVLEKRVWGYAKAGKGLSAYGAIRLERDVNGIIGVVSKGNYGVREVFGKVGQILMVTNMEEEEWEELLAEEEEGLDGGMVWVLTEEEKMRAREIVRE